jgi:hypothetical protein
VAVRAEKSGADGRVAFGQQLLKAHVDAGHHAHLVCGARETYNHYDRSGQIGSVRSCD